MKKVINIDLLQEFLKEFEGYQTFHFTEEEKGIMQEILNILTERDVTVIRAKKILEFCITATNFSKIGG
ncbi:hypothetical protein FDF69_16685 [Clostridium sporogenes]|uniref:hypothetical protein n=1 Tax=Clostridium sporogenes TaxID=1509 RepID=UPI0013CF9B35|nr:hypothetical protein [Clostridium sporogenes]NFF69088.1 hypothetical protein [Clostridium sporogenes]NFF98762.1 hypothetical protein [Clostridium sporogenes]NFG07887.1 hypothetical protein [Clostridium sporogenes]NFG52362.1 hypothetical protein [Clostridium sporogenes]NFP84409.1 hypothetical protein [Clostridium sporogenes]